MNNVVTVLYLLRALRRRIIVYCALSKIQNLDDAFRASLATARSVVMTQHQGISHTGVDSGDADGLLYTNISVIRLEIW